jgi:hypothetical protein
MQFAFALPYQGYFNVSPLFWKSWGYGADVFPPSIGGFLGTAPPFTGFPDGTKHFSSSWGIDFNYDMPLGFLPENLQYFSISGRGSIRGGGGTGAYGSVVSNPTSSRVIGYTLEPVRLTLDAGKLFWGPQYNHLVDLWVAWKYDRNLFGYNELVDPTCLTQAVNNGSCSNNTVYAGMTMKLGPEIPGLPATGSVFGAPFFQDVTNRVGFGVLPTATSPGQSASTFKQVYSVSHEDVWAYGTNTVYGEYLKSDLNRPGFAGGSNS